jgi:hypothetical protein
MKPNAFFPGIRAADFSKPLRPAGSVAFVSDGSINNLKRFPSGHSENEKTALTTAK